MKYNLIEIKPGSVKGTYCDSYDNENSYFYENEPLIKVRCYESYTRYYFVVLYNIDERYKSCNRRAFSCDRRSNSISEVKKYLFKEAFDW